MNNKNSQFFGTREETSGWLYKHKIYNYIINDDLSIDVNGNVEISRQNMKNISVKFGNVTGNFWCYDNQLTSLIGSPKTVKGDFWCPHNQLENLIGAPKTVGGNFWCDGNKLTNLLGGPESVGDYFSCSDNKLTSLAGAPEYVGGNFLCESNLLVSLLEMVNCDFKEIYFNIDRKNFQQKELIQILKKYDKSRYKRYELTNRQFHDIVKPVLEKEILKNNLKKSNVKLKLKKLFI